MIEGYEVVKEDEEKEDIRFKILKKGVVACKGIHQKKSGKNIFDIEKDDNCRRIAEEVFKKKG